MRFKFSIDANWNVTVTSPELGDAWQKTRQLRRVPQGATKGTFPLPPDKEVPAAGEAHAPLCAGDLKALERAQQDVVQRRSETSEAFGRYLFDTLIGQDLWSQIVNEVTARPVAAGAKVHVVELALCWNADQGDLHRLPWELMRSPDGFLVASGKPRIAVTRMVAAPPPAPGASPKPPPDQLEMPPRVLFVIGTAATDRAIRPGAEILGLLRDLRSGNRVIFPRVLERASPKRLRAMMASFRPQVVHFICHGDVDSGRGFLELQVDDPGQDPRRFAASILTDLEVDGLLPQAVVLSACQTGTMLQGQQSAPLATRLVEGGIPVVVGMAGRVSDLACRLFTRRFGETLLKGEPLVKAATDARRAAFADGTPKTIDWAYPAVFFAEHVPSGFAPVSPAKDNEQVPSQIWIDKYEVERKPVFCGRQEFFDAYEQMFAEQAARPVIAAYGEPKSGKSRLIFELTAQALRDGHVPIVVASDDRTWEPPRNSGEFISQLVQAILFAYRTFGIDPPGGLLLQELEPFDRTNPRLPKSLGPYLKDRTSATALMIQMLLQEDLGPLIRAARAKHPAVGRAKGLPILMLDAIDKYDKELLSDLFNAKVLGTDGFGPLRAEPGDLDRELRIPVVLTFDYMSGPALEILKSIVEAKGARKWLSILPLTRFRDDGEDLLAYERVLLHPHDKALLEGVSDKPIAVSDKVDAGLDRWHLTFRRILKGRPTALSEADLYALADQAKEEGYYQFADDEAILKAGET